MAADLKAGDVIATIHRLSQRIRERFPSAALNRTADRLLASAEATAGQIARIMRPNLVLRALIALLIAAIPASLFFAVRSLHLGLEFAAIGEFVTFFQASVESLIFLGAGILFLVTIENRIRRQRALAAIHELRVLAHLVDMHQLEKDPIYVLGGGPTTASSPERTMTAFELNRYLDYCGELLSLIGKIGALYGKRLNDGVALAAIDNIEELTTSLSRKIWQKEMLLDRAVAREP
ncbi:MAG: hypothetical protein ACYTDU_05905 [Planctomycetota bacterium]|jgi:hypothetical protein